MFPTYNYVNFDNESLENIYNGDYQIQTNSTGEDIIVNTWF